MASPHADVDQQPRPRVKLNRRDSWHPRPTRLVIGVVLIAIGLAWSSLNPAPAQRTQPQVTHGLVPTAVQELGGVRVRPLVGRVDGHGEDVLVSLHNAGVVSRAITPSDFHLTLAGHQVRLLDSASHPIPRAVLAPRRSLTGSFHVAAALVPGASMTYAPSWAAGRRVSWVLWQ